MLQQIRPLSEREAQKLTRGSIVRLRGIESPALRRFNARRAKVTAKLPDGSFKVRVLSEGTARGEREGTEGQTEERHVLTLPLENVRGCPISRVLFKAKHSPDGQNLDGTCANPVCSAAPTVTEGQLATRWAEENLKRCSGCQHAQYCSAACQKLHWKGGHKKECGLLKAWKGGE
uniref:phytol kinase n=1 Tax=Chromera velia CCMP2878 TaxID=1169474 RepID=A0A0G4FPA5_9ALVE|eukprot:Cvel_17891.t1-p1 / transcript=Cvel_17891.t1 / gene=Cvel_17891 / organism=Chromera_velia_CCMP2878 / gene_product=hypothetical protein / transcript_product=hypothetical protein / location=Cvel_scaffold1452:9768-10289(-) / protein_length=174 / sequence_SO=supercontig / SO=protein_coding / is_pseudo=false